MQQLATYLCTLVRYSKEEPALNCRGDVECTPELDYPPRLMPNPDRV